MPPPKIVTQKSLAQPVIGLAANGQAQVMRTKGSVSRLPADHEYESGQLLAMLSRSKTTFPVLSRPQTAPR